MLFENEIGRTKLHGRTQENNDRRERRIPRIRRKRSDGWYGRGGIFKFYGEKRLEKKSLRPSKTIDVRFVYHLIDFQTLLHHK